MARPRTSDEANHGPTSPRTPKRPAPQGHTENPSEPRRSPEVLPLERAVDQSYPPSFDITADDLMTSIFRLAGGPVLKVVWDEDQQELRGTVRYRFGQWANHYVYAAVSSGGITELLRILLSKCDSVRRGYRRPTPDRLG